MGILPDRSPGGEDEGWVPGPGSPGKRDQDAISSA